MRRRDDGFLPRQAVRCYSVLAGVYRCGRPEQRKRGWDVVLLLSSHYVLLDPLFGWDPHRMRHTFSVSYAQ